jgi:hypothetical protein
MKRGLEEIMMALLIFETSLVAFKQSIHDEIC